ncbi:MAG: dTMP kinase [Anaerolineae bacterium]|jgi:dTMP kinase
MGLFITFEGPDGSGKTTQIELLAAALRSAGHDVTVTREPGGTPIGDQIRAVLHDVGNTAMVADAESLLYAASRAQHVGQLIRPALAQGTIVLCDRYIDSTIAYQGYGRGLDLAALRQINAFATGGLKPDLTVYLDCPVEEGLKRKQRAMTLGEGEWNRLDREEIAFHQRVYQGYQALMTAERERWLALNASRPIEEIQEEIQKAVETLLSRA